jgi:hypothetical protein
MIELIVLPKVRLEFEEDGSILFADQIDLAPQSLVVRWLLIAER